MIKHSSFNLNILKKFIKIILKKIFYISNSSIFHNTKPTYETDGLITSHVFGGGYSENGDVNFQKALNLGRKEFVHNLYHEWRLYVASMILKMFMQKTNINYIELGDKCDYINHPFQINRYYFPFLGKCYLILC